MSLTLHVVAHTHWDREWYRPLGRFRQRLVALVDELLDDPPPEGASFLLDGQAIVLEDYLHVRPERRAELSALLRKGRLEAGPWYVLADELIPGAEALVRNLLAGRRALRALRADAPPVLYCPDSFGHPAALPTLAAGFDLDAVIVWRGYGGRRWPAGDSAWWSGFDGTRVLLLHLPPDGYEFGSSLPTGAEAAAARWRRIREVLAPRATLGVAILQNGADHHARQEGQAEAVRALAAAAAPDAVRPSSLSAFVGDALERARAASLPEVRGELRDSYGYTWTLQGTFGTRAAQKRTNARVERLLARDAEPWAALARVAHGRSRRHLLDAAWRALLECHPHDTLCGCSIDEVAQAAEVRWTDANVQSTGVRDDAILDLVGHDPAHARERRGEWKPVVLVRNPAPRAREGIAHVIVDTFVADVAVGPGSAGQAIPIPGVLPPLGLPGTHQVLRESVVHARTESLRHYPDDDLVVRREVLLAAGPVPAYGVVAVPQEADADDRVAHAPAGVVSASVAAGGGMVSNGALVVRVAPDGMVTIGDDRGREVRDAVALECRRDVGDLYTAAPREHAPPARFGGVRLAHAGPLRGSLALRWDVAHADGAGTTRVDVDISLDAGEPFARIHVRGDHRGSDQRIRMLLRTGVASPRVWADAAFGAVERVALAVPAEDAERETPPPTAPLHRYVSLFGAQGGATVYSDGLAEYEAGADGTVAVTLLRAVGELSRPDIPERPGNAGWPTPTPGAQANGPFEAAFAVCFHGAARDAATIDLVERVADDVLLPLQGASLRSALATPAPFRGVALEGAGLAFSALKESDDGAWLVARCVNLCDEPVEGRWRFGFAVSEARRARLDETPGEPLAIGADGAIAFRAAPREVVTVVVR